MRIACCETPRPVPRKGRSFLVAEQRGPLGVGRAHRPGTGRTGRQLLPPGQTPCPRLPNYRLVRFADDWCLVIAGNRADAETLPEEAAQVLSTMGLRLSPEKTLITHIDEGLNFLGWRVERHRKKGTTRRFVYTFPSKKALPAVKDKVRTLCRQDVNLPLEVLHWLNRMLRGWTAYFRFGVSQPPSNTCAPASGGRSSGGCGVRIAEAPGRRNAAATAAAGGGPQTAT